MDGYITIGTKINSKDLEGELKQLKRELSKYEKENQMLLKQKAKIELDTKEAEQKINDINAKLEQIEVKKSSLALQRENAPKYSESYFEAVEQLNQLQIEESKYLGQHKETLDVIQKQETALSDINSKIEHNAKQQSLLKNEIIGVNNELRQQSTYDIISNKISGIIGKVTKWGLALFGIRGAYSMISRAMSTLSQQDKNMANQIKYIQWALANAIAPIVKFIIGAVKLLMDYINKIWRALFGHDLFKGTKEFAKSMKSASGSAKEIRKELAGFDEMNILGNNTALAGDTGVGGGVNFDDAIKSVEDLGKKIKEKMKEAKSSVEDMKKSLEDKEAYNRAYGNYGDMVRGMVSLTAGIDLAYQGVFDTIHGLLDLFMGWLKGDKKRIEKGAKELEKGLEEIFEGLFYGIYGIFLLVWGWIKAQALGLADWLYKNMMRPILVMFGYNAEELDKAWEKAMNIVRNDAYFTKDEVSKTFSSGRGRHDGRQFGDGIASGIGEGLNKAKQNSYSVSGSVLNAFSQEKGKNAGKSFGSGLKDGLVAGLNLMIAKLNLWIANLNNLKIGGIGLNIKPIKPIALAKGTILNNPGRGVPIGNAIAGERGREAVLPLSDSQLLEELGSTIGRYITINLTNETNLDGRTIARKVSQLSNNDNFLRNR